MHRAVASQVLRAPTGTWRPPSRRVHCSAVADAVDIASPAKPQDRPVKVRFAPSPTGNLHVGGARTALFNWLYARGCGGSMVLRVEDTDAARSTRESEEAVLADLQWLGITYDEGPDVGGPNGPYRQSERKEIYNARIEELKEAGRVYPCFCSDEELDAMRAAAEAANLPPVYNGKWARASAEDVAAEMEKGTPFCYRFRVPANKTVVVRDLVRGDVTFNTDTLGDFVVMRSNGLPVYNFCVAVDDAMMGVTHVLRAEEHLPNTLKQLLIYDALNYEAPQFGHMSLILAPDKSKLSKRHGATSVGEFRDQGFLKTAMMNYLALLGWNDGTEQEIYSPEELQGAFTIDRITKSPAVFDKVKLSWMNGQHLRALPAADVQALVGPALVEAGLLSRADSPFAAAAVALMQQSLELVSDGETELRRYLRYPLAESLSTDAAAKFVEDNFRDLAAHVVEQYDSGDLPTAVAEGTVKKWIKAAGKAKECKGKRLFMPLRLALTGQMAGPDVAQLLQALHVAEDGEILCDDYVALPQRVETLRAWLAGN